MTPLLAAMGPARFRNRSGKRTRRWPTPLANRGVGTGGCGLYAACDALAPHRMDSCGPVAAPQRCMSNVILVITLEPVERDLALFASAWSHGARRCELHVAAGLAEGIARIRQCEIHAVILECTQPEPLTVAAIEGIRRVASDVPVLVVVQWGRVSAVASLMKAGADDVLVRGECTAEGLRLALDASSGWHRGRVEAARVARDRNAHLVHDLRSPLQAVFAAVELLVDQVEGDERARRTVALLARAADGLAAKLRDAEVMNDEWPARGGAPERDRPAAATPGFARSS